MKQAAEELKEKFEKEIGTPNDYFNHRRGLMNEVFDFFWSEIESRDKQIRQLSDIITERTHLLVRANEQISELDLANKMYTEDLKASEQRLENVSISLREVIANREDELDGAVKRIKELEQIRDSYQKAVTNEK